MFSRLEYELYDYAKQHWMDALIDDCEINGKGWTYLVDGDVVVVVHVAI